MTILRFAVISSLICFTMNATQSNAADPSTFMIRVIDAKSGKPLAFSHILVFMGATPDDVRFHRGHADTTTDAQGLVVLTMDFAQVKFAQVWIDGYSLCEKHPNLENFDVGEVHRHGMNLNRCSALTTDLKSDQLNVYVRPDTHAEKMRQ